MRKGIRCFELGRFRRKRLLAVAVIWMAGAACGTGARDDSNRGTVGTPGSAARPATVETLREPELRIDEVPLAARTALGVAMPEFLPWPSAPLTGAARAREQSNAGRSVSIVSGHFRIPNATDYVLVGFDRQLHGIRIVAILDQGAGKFSVISVSDGPARPDSLAMVPDRSVGILSSPSGTTVDVVVRLVSDPLRVLEQYTWVSNRQSFLLVSPP